MKILIAENDWVVRKTLNGFLSGYGDCDLAVDGRELLDAFGTALRGQKPYALLCVDSRLPKTDGVQVLKAVRELERQRGVAPKARVKLVLTAALSEAELARAAAGYGCEVFATRPVDLQKFTGLLRKLGLEGPEGHPPQPPGAPAAAGEAARAGRAAPTRGAAGRPGGSAYFQAVYALPGHQLEVRMGTGSSIRFDFRTRLRTARFGALQDEELFQSVSTDGNYLIFSKTGRMPVRITASEFMDLVLVDRTK